MGPTTWEAVAGRLRDRGATVAVPSLLGVDLTAEQAEAVAEACVEVGAAEVVLVGHSGAGPLLPAAGAALAGREVRRAAYVFVDAALPHPGRSRLASIHPAFQAQLAGLVVDEVLPPWADWFDEGAIDALVPDPELRARFQAELRPVPVAALQEPMPMVEDWPDAPCAYLRFSHVYEGEEAEAAAQGWAVASVDGNHLHMLVDPDGVADALAALLGRLGVSL